MGLTKYKIYLHGKPWGIRPSEIKKSSKSKELSYIPKKPDEEFPQYFQEYLKGTSCFSIDQVNKGWIKNTKCWID